ncbi:MAG: VOC family protein [Solirubrobacteraceae bacterium]
MVAELWVQDGQAAVDFYKAAFEAVEVHRAGGSEESPALVSQLAVGPASFWVSDAAREQGRLSPAMAGGATGRVLLVFDDPAALVARAVALGAKEVSPVEDEHGWLLGKIEDPFGHEWEIGRPLGQWPPQPARTPQNV